MASPPKWYSRYDSQAETLLAQGIILPDFSYINPKGIKTMVAPESSARKLPVLSNDVIILTQSCELQKASLKHVHLAPVLTLTELVNRSQGQFSEEFTEADLFEELKTHRRHAKYLLNRCDMHSFKEFEDEFLVVCLDLAFVVSPEYIKDYIAKSGQRYFLALNPPYREGMAQSYGRYFMRVGNPIDYDEYRQES